MLIDTEFTFTADRLKRICDRLDLDFKTICENISLRRPLTEQQFDTLLNEALGEIDRAQASGIPYSVIIVDSIIRPFRAQFDGMRGGELAPRQQAIASALDRLLRMAVAGSIAVVITNQVVANVDMGFMAKFAPKFKPAGGNVVAHAVTNRLSLRKKGKSAWILTTTDVPHLPVQDIEFMITETGIHDIDYDVRKDEALPHTNDKYKSDQRKVDFDHVHPNETSTVQSSSTARAPNVQVKSKMPACHRVVTKRKQPDSETGLEDTAEKRQKIEEEKTIEQPAVRHRAATKRKQPDSETGLEDTAEKRRKNEEEKMVEQPDEQSK